MSTKSQSTTHKVPEPQATTHKVPEPQSTGKNSESFQSQQGINKAAVAREIFNQTPPNTPRKEVLHRFMNEAQLTKAGAATYYQNMKKEAGLVHQRTTTTTTAPTEIKSTTKA